MDALALEVNCRFLKPLLDLAEQHAAAFDSFLVEWQVQKPQLQDQTNWVSLRFCEALAEWLAARTGEDKLVDHVVAATYSPKAFGFMYPLMRAFGGPGVGYKMLPTFSAMLNKVSVVTVEKKRGGRARIQYRPVAPEHRERSAFICKLRRAQLAAGPTLWALPPARVVEHECQTKGGEACVYELTFTERTGWLYGLVGAAVGVGLGHLLGGQLVVLVALVVAGASLGRLLDERRQARELRRFNEDQNRALSEAARETERRFVELERAKREVDQKVEERTAELAAATVKLQHSLAQLEQLGKVKDEFLANVSHELKTPLTLILGPTEDLLTGRVPGGRVRDELRLVHQSATRLSSLVNDLLVLARLQAGQLQLEPADVDLSELASQASEQFRAVAERKKVDLSIERSTTTHAFVDPRRFEFCITNLLSNALKFTPAGGRVQVRIFAPSPDQVALEVSDTGAGIAPENLPLIFGRFNKFDAPGSSNSSGTGIGLALVKELVELHGGSARVESEPGRGATFTLTVPRSNVVPLKIHRDVAVPVLPAGEEAAFHLEAGPSSQETAPADAPLVLLVEDNDDMRGFVQRVLERKFRVLAVENGLRAFEELEHARPAAIVSDVMMPGMNGYELARRVKKTPSLRGIPVLLLTARKDSAWAVEGFDAGADDYILKPFHSEELLARVGVQIRLRRLMDREVAQEKLATLGSMAAGLAHEIRNPVGAILAGLPRLKRDLDQVELRPAAREMLDVALDCAQRISRVVDDVMMIGQPERANQVPWDLHEGLDAAIRLLSHRAAPGVEFRRDFSFDGQVLCRPPALNQVFLNLLDNALAAVGEQGKIEVATHAADGGVTVTVSDSGPGVPAELRNRIFDPFFTTKDVGAGSGLGLHISRNLVFEHGGTLDVVGSTSGAVFRVWLPVRGGTS